MYQESLVGTKRIITAFNSGDIDSLKEIAQEIATNDVEVYIPSVSCNVRGLEHLIAFWKALGEAYPNGIFSTSDTYIDEKRIVQTAFIFTGTKLFPLLLNGIPLDGEGECIEYSNKAIEIDQTKPTYTSEELMEIDSTPEMRLVGRIYLDLDLDCKVKKFTFNCVATNHFTPVVNT